MESSNAAIVRRAVDIIWNRGELDLADRLFAAAYVNHGGLISDLVRGPEAIKISVAFFRIAFPKLHITIEALTAEKDTVEMSWAAESNSLSLPDRARHIERRGTLTGTTRSTLAGGQITESWTEWDQTGVLQRLKVLLPGART